MKIAGEDVTVTFYLADQGTTVTIYYMHYSVCILASAGLEELLIILLV